jgi:hypothetical protein
MNPDFEKRARQAFASREALEISRRRQQGYGKPIITGVVSGTRVVAIGSRLKYSPQWRFFTDFLLDHLKDEIGRNWAVQAQRDGKDHPLFEWLSALQKVSDDNRRLGRLVYEAHFSGFLGALWRLGYALYLIEHHDQKDEKLIKRLRVPRSFLAAYHETQVAAAFAIAGYKITMAEVRQTSSAKPEFWATSNRGVRYAVEAKCKDGWSNRISDRPAFLSELRQWIRHQVHKCSAKKLTNPVYVWELAIEEDLTETEWQNIYDSVQEFLNEASSMTVGGKPVPGAYVIVSNNTDVLKNVSVKNRRTMMLFGFRMDGWVENGSRVDIETAFDAHDLHRDLHQLLACLVEVDEVPQSFDGIASIVDELGIERSTEIQIGKRMAYADKDGIERTGTILDATAAGDKVILVLQSDDTQNIVSVPLSDIEQKIVDKFGNAAFGKPEKIEKDLKGDFLKFYDWCLDVFSNYDRQSLLNQILKHPHFAEMERLEQPDLVVRVAREVTKAAMASSGRPGQV